MGTGQKQHCSRPKWILDGDGAEAALQQASLRARGSLLVGPDHHLKRQGAHADASAGGCYHTTVEAPATASWGHKQHHYLRR